MKDTHTIQRTRKIQEKKETETCTERDGEMINMTEPCNS